MNAYFRYIFAIFALLASIGIEAKMGRFFASKPACLAYGVATGGGATAMTLYTSFIQPLEQEKEGFIEQLKTEQEKASFLEKKLENAIEKDEQKEEPSKWQYIFGNHRVPVKAPKMRSIEYVVKYEKGEASMPGVMQGYVASQDLALRSMSKQLKAAHEHNVVQGDVVKAACEHFAGVKHELKVARREKWELASENIELRREKQKFVKEFGNSLGKLQQLNDDHLRLVGLTPEYDGKKHE